MGVPLDIGYESWYQKTSVPGLSGGGNCVIFISFESIPVRDGRTDRQKDTLPKSVSHASIAESDSNISTTKRCHQRYFILS